jgi:hypothetical protein
MSAFCIPHPCGVSLGRETRPADVVSIEGAEFSETIPGSGYYRIPPFTAYGELVACLVYVSGNRVTQLSFGLADPEKYGSSWEDATEAKERQCAEDTEKWLAHLGVPSGEYSWGTVWTGFDMKGFSGGGLVRYSERKEQQ